MYKLPNMIDLSRSDEEKEDIGQFNYEAPDYPPGLSICLTQDELEKLDLEDDCEVGDMIHMHCIARVTSVSKNEINGEQKCRVELQIIAIACDEEEDDENDEAEEDMRPLRPYR